MPDFLAKAACRVRRPQHLAARRIFPRPDLIAKLLRERHVARFVVAPDGYGKTALALEYADTVHRFEHVAWLDGRIPCFLRDLDRGIVAEALLEADREPLLVVIEDVPPLDPARVDALSSDMDRLLERGCEVLVTCSPACDAFARHRDRVRLSAEDPVNLSLSDNRIAFLSDSGIVKQFVDILQTAGCAVQKVLAFPGTVQPPCHGHFIEINIQLVVGIIKGNCHRRITQRLSRLCSGKNNVLHIAAAQRLGTLFSKHPAHGIRYIALSTAVRSDNSRDALVELQIHLVGKGFEALHLNGL